MTAKSQEAKKDEFRKYLEKAGVLELLTKSLVQLYEEPDKPGDAVNYLKTTVGGTPQDKETIEKLRNENSDLKAKLAELERAQLSLQSKVTALETKGATAAEAKADDIPAAAQDVEGNSEPAPAVPAAEEAPEPAAEPATTETTESKPEEAAETTPAEPEPEAEPMDTDGGAEEAAPAPTPAEEKETPAPASDETPAAAPQEAPAESGDAPAAAPAAEATS